MSNLSIKKKIWLGVGMVILLFITNVVIDLSSLYSPFMHQYLPLIDIILLTIACIIIMVLLFSINRSRNLLMEKLKPVYERNNPTFNKKLDSISLEAIHEQLLSSYIALENEIVDRQSIEKALIQSEQDYKNFIDTAQLFIWRLDSKGNFTYANTEVLKNLEYLPKEIMGKHYKFLVPENMHELADTYFETQKQIHTSLAFNMQVKAKSGKLLILRCKAKTERSIDGQFIGIYGTGQDITRSERFNKASNYLSQINQTFDQMSMSELVELTLHKGLEFTNSQFIRLTIKHQNKRYACQYEIHREEMGNFQCMDTEKITPEAFQTRMQQTKVMESLQFNDTNESLKISVEKDRQTIAICEVRRAEGGFTHLDYDIMRLTLQNLYSLIARKQAAESLQKSEFIYRRLFENTPVMIFTTNLSGCITSVNPLWLETFGYTKEEVVGQRIISFISANQKSLAQGMGQKVLNEGQVNNVEYQFVSKSGKTIDTLVSATYTPKDTDETYAIQAAMIDITLMKQAEKELIRLQVGVEQSANNIVITDTQGNVIYANKAFYQITGYQAREVIGQNVSIIQSGRHDDAFYTQLWETISRGEAWKGELCNRKKNGELYWESALITPIKHEGETLNYLAIKEDITQKKLADKKLLNTIITTEERQRKIFAEDLHDELGPHLSSIRLFIAELDNEDLPAERRQQVVQMLDTFLKEAVDKIRTISNQLMPNILMDFGLTTALESFIDRINQSGAISILFQHPEERFTMDKTKEIVLYRVIIELINNTLKHARATQINLELYGHEDLVEMIYADNGGGFDLERELEQSKGLGLTNIINRIKVLHGDYHFNSIPDQGFRFSVTFTSENE